jgi:hypothetical protein
MTDCGVLDRIGKFLIYTVSNIVDDIWSMGNVLRMEDERISKRGSYCEIL